MKRAFVALLLAFFSVISMAETPMKVSTGREYEQGWHEVVSYLYIQSTADNLSIQNIELNHGNCSNVQVIPAYIPQFPMSVKYGEKIKVILKMGSATLCDFLDVRIQTNKGAFTYKQ